MNVKIGRRHVAARAWLRQRRPLSEVAQVWDKFLVRLGSGSSDEEAASWFEALAGKARALVAVDRSADAVVACNELLARMVEPISAPAEPVASALATKARALRLLGRFDDALRVVDALARMLGEVSDGRVRLRMAQALWERGQVFAQTERRDLAASVFEELVESLSGVSESQAVELVARAMVERAFNIELLGRPDEAIAIYCQVVERFGAVMTGNVADTVAHSRINAANLLATTRGSDELANELERETDPDRLALSARALVTQADELLARGSPEQALELLDAVIDGLDGRDERGARKVTALALADKTVALNRLGDDDAMAPFEAMVEAYATDALEAFQEEATRLWHTVEPHHLRRLAWALLTTAMILHALDRDDESRAALEQLLKRFDGNPSPEIADSLAFAHQLLDQLTNQP